MGLGNRLGSVTQPWVPHVGDILVISGRTVVMQVFHLGGTEVVRDAILGMLSWFVRVIMVVVGHGKVVVRGEGVMTMEGVIILF